MGSQGEPEKTRLVCTEQGTHSVGGVNDLVIREVDDERCHLRFAATVGSKPNRSLVEPIESKGDRFRNIRERVVVGGISRFDIGAVLQSSDSCRGGSKNASRGTHLQIAKPSG